MLQLQNAGAALRHLSKVPSPWHSPHGTCFPLCLRSLMKLHQAARKPNYDNQPAIKPGLQLLLQVLLPTALCPGQPSAKPPLHTERRIKYWTPVGQPSSSSVTGSPKQSLLIPGQSRYRSVALFRCCNPTVFHARSCTAPKVPARSKPTEING